ncbi:MmgE/PrpD family protein [uncultured Aeromicrobium sp.]|uniref:MmgE/PrpD family protein n=1 Tax=uncultured Aeromicrobium sp. TaxID=337820 RepID=UPI0025EF934F|nr:MmgE/PrpD family protein [uncultured Aeromicrobium sp.]
MSHARELAEFATTVHIGAAPQVVVDKLKTTLLHNLGMLRAGGALSDPAVQVASPSDSAQDATLLWSGRRAHRDRAVLANAAAIHARTQDDTHLPAITHLAATCLPPLLATAELTGASGRQLLDAMLASYEVGAAVAVPIGPPASARGFRPSSVLGAVAASVGVARLMKLNADQTVSAIGLAASFGGGTGQTWVAGTGEWQYQVGVAGRNGLLAAELAATGVTGAPDSLEGAAGLYAAFAGFSDLPGEPWRLGTTWRTLDVTYKPFPVCAINQMPVTILIQMMSELEFGAEEIASLELRLSPAEAAYPGTDAPGPFDGVGSALMSAQWCLAIAAIERGVTRSMVEDLAREDYRELARRITVTSDPELNSGQCVISVKGDRGEWSSRQVTCTPSFNWDFDEVHRRLAALGEERGMSMSALDGLATCLRTLEHASAADVIQALLVP